MLCKCGCGREAKPGRSYLKGHAGHAAVRSRSEWGPHLWTVEDRGFETPCWIWKGHTTNGYGRGSRNGRKYRAHVRAWIEGGRERAPGLQLDHLCGQRACVRVDHLEQVTNAVNARRGKKAKLSPEQVSEIRARYSGARGEQSALAREFGVSQGTIWFIVNDVTWSAA